MLSRIENAETQCNPVLSARTLPCFLPPHSEALHCCIITGEALTACFPNTSMKTVTSNTRLRGLQPGCRRPCAQPLCLSPTPQQKGHKGPRPTTVTASVRLQAEELSCLGTQAPFSSTGTSRGDTQAPWLPPGEVLSGNHPRPHIAFHC